MEESIVKKRLIAAVLFAELPRPSYAPGNFTIMVQASGILITYIFDAGPGHYTLDHIVTWRALTQGTANPIIQAMTGLLAAARDFKP